MEVIERLQELESYKEFCINHLPKNISKEEILTKLKFLSPILIVVRGSYINGKRYSPKGKKDLDLIVVTYKKKFWGVSDLNNYFQIKNKMDVEIDLSILSLNEFKNIFYKDSSIFHSLKEGFTILYKNGYT